MIIQSLKVTNFRNLCSLESEFATGINVLYGENGSGKTNLLEAVFTLCLGRSQRAVRDSVLVNSAAEHYRLEGQLGSPGNAVDIAVAYQLGGRKKITVNSAAARASELFEQVSLVASGPEDSVILSGPPSGRRLFLDLYLSQLSQVYLVDLSDYQKALSQKNAALKHDMDPTPFDPLLITLGSKIMRARSEFLAELALVAADLYRDMTGGEELQVCYRPRVPAGPGRTGVDEIEAAFGKALLLDAERERVMQTSLVGPHRDDIEFDICGLPARTHGSQGQWRLAAVSLKLAVYELLKQKRGEPPILLLDEILAELDLGRSERLVEKLFQAGQLFLTTAVDPPESLTVDSRRFRIAAGDLVEVG